MAQKSTNGKPKSMKIGTVLYSLKRSEASGDTASKYYLSLKERLAELKG